MRNATLARMDGRAHNGYMTTNYFRTVTLAYARMYLAARVEFLCRRQIRIAREGE